MGFSFGCILKSTWAEAATPGSASARADPRSAATEPALVLEGKQQRAEKIHESFAFSCCAGSLKESELVRGMPYNMRSPRQARPRATGLRPGPSRARPGTLLGASPGDPDAYSCSTPERPISDSRRLFVDCGLARAAFGANFALLWRVSQANLQLKMAEIRRH